MHTVCYILNMLLCPFYSSFDPSGSEGTIRTHILNKNVCQKFPAFCTFKIIFAGTTRPILIAKNYQRIGITGILKQIDQHN